ncbi:Crp/Fnr family transcriptional regulator [Motiliproteus sp. SC1-56]|uniref:Crp/Fnr family transcriptional regulator n=1 Tax=Motiliproteus sp. SC1-56 TaxID=2799565 RepID=UPI001A90A481|nr:Crp/Fnr family transcriptional regulator [Motiliproteus sp. SC1-56]
MDGQQRQRALAAIKRHYLFAPLDEPELERLVAGVRLHELEAEQVLFHQEEEAKRFFLLADGQIKLFRRAADGNEKVVEIVHPGQTIAEAVLFMQRNRYPVNAQAVRPARVYAIDGQAYMALLQQNMAACMRILGDLSMRLHARLNDVVNLTQQNATFRVVRYLCELLPHDAENGALILLNTPKQVIASRLSVTPETLSRIMANLAKAGVIEVHGREIRVRDIAGLRSFE